MSKFYPGQRVPCIDGKMTSSSILEILTQFPTHLRPTYLAEAPERMRSGQITRRRDPQGRDER